MKLLKPDATVNRQIKFYNGKIASKLKLISQIEDYSKVIQAIVPLVELARKESIKADLDNGETKKTWEMILADVLTIKSDVEESYSDISDDLNTTREMIEMLKLKKENS